MNVQGASSRVLLRVLPVFACAAIVGLSGAAAIRANEGVTLGVAGRANATPSIASSGAFVAVAFGATTPDGATDVYAAISRDGGRTFGAPVRVNNVPGDARLNGEQPPRITLTGAPRGDPKIVVVWTTKGHIGTRLVWTQSTDGGRTYQPAASVAGSDAAGNRGWHNTFAAANGSVFVAWLDHREMADHTMGAAPAHQHDATAVKEDGAAMAQRSKLYIGTIDGTIPPHPVTAGVCYCCKTALAQSTDGSLFAAWRHVYPGNFRDIAFSVSRDGGRTFAAPARVSEDKWMLDGCPDDGPAVAIDARNTVHVVWPTLVKDERSGEPTIAVFYATTTDGRAFTPRRRLPTVDVAHHPQIVIGASGAATIAWDESGKGTRRVVMAEAPAFGRTVISEGSGVYPAIAVAEGRIITAYTVPSQGGSVLRIITAS